MAIKAFRINTYEKQGVLLTQKSLKPVVRPDLESRRRTFLLRRSELLAAALCTNLCPLVVSCG
jgi:hypothetical protein